jgi:hypothetical protein
MTDDNRAAQEPAMRSRSRCRQPFPTIMLLVLVALDGCGSDRPAFTGGTTSEVQLPESDPPVLTKAVADRIRTGMAQEEVLAILRDAARETPAAKSSLELAYTQGKLNTVRYDLTLAQGRRRLVLAFKSATLAEKTVEGLD